jgi:hypothetical protein
MSGRFEIRRLCYIFEAKGTPLEISATHLGHLSPLGFLILGFLFFSSVILHFIYLLVMLV